MELELHIIYTITFYMRMKTNIDDKGYPNWTTFSIISNILNYFIIIIITGII